MEVKFDFSLNERRYGVVEQTIFKMVLRGIDSAEAISALLWIFSDDVKATAIQKLVNSQVLRADLTSGKLYLSDGIISIISACHNSTYTVELPESLLSQMTEGVLLVESQQSIEIQREIDQLKISILNHILPDISIAFLAPTLTFSITEVSPEHE